jgi:DNA repair protein RecO (recombination protein O)
MLSPYPTPQTYQTIGINLKAIPFGENDRLVTILTPEYGLIRVVAPSARQYKSKLTGKSELFVVNQLLISKGKSMDRISQAETIESYPQLSKHLGTLTASQYLAELVLNLALDESPQGDFYTLLREHLYRLERISHEEINHTATLFAHLAQGVFHFLAIAGIAPQVHQCYLSQKILSAPLDQPQWRVGFTFEGGIVDLKISEPKDSSDAKFTSNLICDVPIHRKLGAMELILLQQLGENNLPDICNLFSEDHLPLLDMAWVKLELLLRNYAEYQSGKELKAAKLIDALSPLEF